MKISNRVKRNISFALLLIGVACVIARGWYVALDPSSGKAWFDLCAMVFLTGCCLSDFLVLRRRVSQDG